jgi:hypothetical protein
MNNPQPPMQFSLRSLMMTTAGCAVLFGAFRWLGVPPGYSLFASAVLAASRAAAAALVVAIVRGVPPDDGES